MFLYFMCVLGCVVLYVACAWVSHVGLYVPYVHLWFILVIVYGQVCIGVHLVRSCVDD